MIMDEKPRMSHDGQPSTKLLRTFRFRNTFRKLTLTRETELQNKIATLEEVEKLHWLLCAKETNHRTLTEGLDATTYGMKRELETQETKEEIL